MTAISDEFLKNLPDSPGVYLMKDDSAKIIYVGKAKNIKNRVTSYFRKTGDQSYKTARLVDTAFAIDFVLTRNEVEALLLERNLISEHQPMFNILLQDDKQYPLLRIDLREDWPRFTRVRHRKDDGAVYLGPFGSASRLKTAMQAMYRVFPLIRCSKIEFEHAKRPCNYYHMKLCLGPCTLPVDKELYKQMVRDAISFIEGNDQHIVKDLRRRMIDASRNRNYEAAATLRDQVQAIEMVQERQVIMPVAVRELDVLWFSDDPEIGLAVQALNIREGRMVGSDGFILKKPESISTDLISNLVLQYYYQRVPPSQILIGGQPIDLEIVRAALAEQKNAPVDVTTKTRGSELKELIDLAQRNASYALSEARRKKDSAQTALVIVAEKLNLAAPPERMECIDISHLQGAATVASNVVFINGRPAKDFYRIYNLPEIEGSVDDYQSIRDVVRRRIERGIRDDDLPDLLVIDGGKGQLTAALEALDEFKGADLRIVSIAKSRLEHQANPLARRPNDLQYSDERIFIPDHEEPIHLEPGAPEFRIFTHIRDEAHRFAIARHRRKKVKKSLESRLDEIPGIGPTLKKRLFETFGSVDGIAKAPTDQLLKIKGLSRKTAEVLKSYLRADEDTGTNESVTT